MGHGGHQVKFSRIHTLALTAFAALAVAQGQTAAPAAPAAPVAPAAAPAPAPAAKIPASNYVVVGNMYYGQGKFDQAYVAFRAAVEIDPRNPAALLGLGRSQVKLRLFKPALETLRSLTKADPKGISGFLALARAYEEEFISSSDKAATARNLETALGVLTDAEAVANASAAKDKNENLSKVAFERGNVYKLKGDAGKAIDSYKQATSLSPDNSLILYSLGDMYAAVGDLPQAITTLQQAVIIDPGDAYNRAYYAKLLALNGNTAAAKPEAAQAARLAPTNAYAVGQYGVVSYLAKDSATARTQLAQAVKLEALRYPEFYYYLGRIALDENSLQAARENLTKAAALGSNNAEYAYYLGLSYERSAGTLAPDRVKARENYERALQLSPSYKLAQEGLNRLK